MYPTAVINAFLAVCVASAAAVPAKGLAIETVSVRKFVGKLISTKVESTVSIDFLLDTKEAKGIKCSARNGVLNNDTGIYRCGKSKYFFEFRNTVDELSFMVRIRHEKAPGNVLWGGDQVPTRRCEVVKQSQKDIEVLECPQNDRLTFTIDNKFPPP
ncbi:hypothetical protein DCS_04949 [Drechmeria coniospora]|uniref:AA1-like domain-containing protein n=1 Tax=Drechmeria coniospora TaxID=98403 RepID=A0A151GLG7_DRECN|nr:hypothetical protein DCS_04949 [Drechmeria coniospora]KYK57936.1 hypothetical protein DCS_04949 [Drechmeria coniospora]ODA83221.1 hypothetical protein RJ55_01732 [Drechmeria coniospora]